MEFDNAGALWLVPVMLILLALLGVWGAETKQQLALWFGIELAPVQRKQIEKYGVACLVGLLVIVAMSLPKVATTTMSLPEKAGEIALMVDVSGSMAARPNPQLPSRLDRVQPMLIETVDHLADLGQPKVSLSGYTNIARSLVPFVGNEDYGYLGETIRRLFKTYATPGQGSVLGRALLDVLPKFSPGNGTVKIVVMYGDGEPFIGLTRSLRPEERALLDQAIQKAKDSRVIVVTVGVGEPDGAKVPLFNARGEFTGEYAQLSGTDFVSFLVEDQLQEIAVKTGGQYFPESRSREVLPYLSTLLASASSLTAGKEIKIYQPLAPWFLCAALPIWLLFVRRHVLD